MFVAPRSKFIATSLALLYCLPGRRRVAGNARPDETSLPRPEPRASDTHPQHLGVGELKKREGVKNTCRGGLSKYTPPLKKKRCLGGKKGEGGGGIPFLSGLSQTASSIWAFFNQGCLNGKARCQAQFCSSKRRSVQPNEVFENL